MQRPPGTRWRQRPEQGRGFGPEVAAHLDQRDDLPRRDRAQRRARRARRRCRPTPRPAADAGSRPWITSQTSEPTTPSLRTHSHYPRIRAVPETPAPRRTRRPCRSARPARCGRPHRGLEGAAGDLAAERHEEADRRRASRRRTITTDLGIEDVDQVGDAGAEELGGVAAPPRGPATSPALRRLVHRLRGDLSQVAPDVARAGWTRRRSRGPPPPAARCRAPRRRPRGSRSCRTCSAGRSASMVMWPTSPATVGGAVVQPAVDDDAAADAGADGDADGVAGAARRAPPPLAQDGAVGVVVERGREAEPVRQPRPERHVDPAEVRGQQHDAASGCRAGRAPPPRSRSTPRRGSPAGSPPCSLWRP